MKIIKKLVAVLSVLALGSVFTSCMNNLGEASLTTKKLAEDLYYMEIEGDDGVPEFLNRGGAKSPKDLGTYLSEFLGKGPFKRSVSVKPSEIACTTFIAADENGGFVAGRNFDWESCVTLILRNKPDEGFESISTVNLNFLGFGEGFAPDGIVNKIKALAGIYVPLDGINEKGLMVADLMAGDKEVTDQNTDKPDITTTSAIRVLLNYADSVDKAIEILNKYDMHSDIGSAHHLFIADKSGKSVDVEWVNNEMIVIETSVLTNHYLSKEKYGTGSDNSKERFNKISEEITKSNGIITETKARDMLESVKASNYVDDEGTQWSIVYSLSDKPFENFYWRSNFTKSFEYKVY